MTDRFLDWRDEYTCEGLFWLPEAPQLQVPGRITTKAGNVPVLSTLSRLLPHGTETPGHILGASKSGDVSLLGCALLVRDHPFERGPFSNQVIGFDLMLFGRHASPGAFARRLLLRFTNTHRLVSSTKLWTFVDPRAPENVPGHLTVHVRTEEKVATVSIDGVRVDVLVRAPVEGSHSARNGDELRVKPEVDVSVEFTRMVPVSDARQLWDDLELFWSLMTGNRSDLVSAVASEYEASADARDRDAGVTDRLLGAVHADAADAECFGDMLFDLTHGAHAGQLSAVLQTWLERRSTLRLAAKLLVDTFSKHVSWESKLGIIAQALEAFHRTSSYRQTFVPPDQYAAIEEGLKPKISELSPDEDLRTSLKKRVEFGNQVSLRRRTKDLMRAMPPALRDAFGRWQGLADVMVETRNAIIHRDPSNAPLPFRETVRIAGHFMLTVHVALLQALGVPDDVIAQRLQMQPLYQNWLSYRR